jgi:glycerate 2-kinase
VSRAQVLTWLDAGIAAVDPRRLTAAALKGGRGPSTVIALGKAAAGMCMGAADALGRVQGVCVTDAPREVPPGVELLIGDHPIPGPASLRAAERALECAASARDRLIVLVSGGASALCEKPLDGIEPEFVAEATRRLLANGASIRETNLVRAHVSAVKAGGLARASTSPVETLVISDVSGLGPEHVGSGPTLSRGRDPGGAIELMRRFGVEVPVGVTRIVSVVDPGPVWGPVEVLADGRTAGEAATEAAQRDGLPARLAGGWLDGPVSECLDHFLRDAADGVTISVGETTVQVTGGGRGGRNTHGALLAAERISGSGDVFAALATDGVDGSSGAAGAVVDSTTVERGGDPAQAIEEFDSATYLAHTGDLVVTGPTGTNVADLWLLWRR